MSARTNSQFLAASVSEFMMFTTSKGLATVGFNCSLGHQGAVHYPTAATTPSPPPRQPRRRGPAATQRNNERAARH